MEAVILILALLFMTFVVLGAYVTVKVVGAAKRSVDRTVAQARRTVEDSTLRARQLTQPGALGQLAELRLSLRTSMRATQDALHAASPEDVSLSEALGLFRRLSAHGHELDDELRRLEHEPDKGRITARLPELRERTRRIVGHADSLRWAAQDRKRRFADDDLAALGDQIEVEAGALRHWTREREPGPEQDSERKHGVPGADPAAPGARTRPATSTPTWPDVSQREAASQELPPAITAQAPSPGFSASCADAPGWQSGFFWKKATRRPESTS